MDLWTLLGWIWAVIVAPTHLFWPLGQIISLAYLVILIWAVRRYTPARVKHAVAARTAPVVWSTSAPIRWLIVSFIANPEWIASRGSEPRIIEKPVEVTVRVPMRRPFKAWLASTIQWIIVGAILASIAWNYRSVSAWMGFFLSP